MGSPLSIAYVVEHLVPELALAVDGDPTTPVTSAAAISGAETGGDSTTGGAEEAATTAWALVFDSSTPFEDKAPHLEDAEALADTIDAYGRAGAGMGGISLDPTSVVVDGDTATVTYDVLFGTNPAYTALTGDIHLVDDAWVVSRDEFCGFMSSARTPCP